MGYVKVTIFFNPTFYGIISLYPILASVSSPRKALQEKSNEMESKEIKYVKRTQKDYSMSFKLSVVREYETNAISLGSLRRKYGIQGNNTIKRWIGYCPKKVCKPH